MTGSIAETATCLCPLHPWQDNAKFAASFAPPRVRGTTCLTLSGSGQYFHWEKQYSQQKEVRSRTSWQMARLIAGSVIVASGDQSKSVKDRVEGNLPELGQFRRGFDSPCVIGFNLIVQLRHFSLLILIQLSCPAETVQFAPPHP